MPINPGGLTGRDVPAGTLPKPEGNQVAKLPSGSLPKNLITAHQPNGTYIRLTDSNGNLVNKIEH